MAETVGGFELLDLLGEGGMGEVYRARNKHVQTMTRAIKVIRPSLASEFGFRERFLREAELLERLHHPNILRIENLGEEGGRFFLVMELLSGQTLAHRLNTRGPLPPMEAAGFIAQALRGAAHAHQQGIVHRDFKPSNLFLTGEGIVKVLDFGIAKAADMRAGLTRTGLTGSPAYFAPEFADGIAASPASDVYSLGVAFFELLTARAPYTAGGSGGDPSAYSIVIQHVTKPFPEVRSLNPGVPEAMAALLGRMVEKKPENRPTAATLAAELEAMVGTGRVVTTPVAFTPPLPASTPAAGGERRAAPGMVLGGFRLVEPVGSGGMGEIWRAENTQVARMVRAVKVIRPELAAIPEFRERFLREAEYLDLLQHPNILRVENIGEERGLLYMVMELLGGKSADQLLGKLSVPAASRIVYEAALGVGHAHRNGIFHRDLKPANIFVTDNGRVLVLDFGIARHGSQSRITRTATGQPGSPAYFAPELVMGKPSSTQSDVYALGVTLFELLAARRPFEPDPSATDSQAMLYLMHAHATIELPDVRQFRPEVGAELNAVLVAATQKDPAIRLADGDSLSAALQPLCTEPIAPAAPGTAATPLRSTTPSRVPLLPAALPAPARGGRRWLFITGALLGLAAAAAVGVAFTGRPAPPTPEAAETGPLPRGTGLASLAAETGAATPATAPTLPAVTLDPAMASISGGTFRQGRPAYGAPFALDTPDHEVTVKSFALEKSEVTVDDYRKFVGEKHVKAPWSTGLSNFSVVGRLPVVNIDATDAAAYCAWRYPQGRLPTESEWERAARGPEDSLYPWGAAFRRECVNGMTGANGALLPPGSHPCGTTAAGIADLSGNVWEWTADAPELYPGSTAKLPPAAGGFHAIRGGSFYNTREDELTATTRTFLAVPNRFTGFRCATDL